MKLNKLDKLTFNGSRKDLTIKLTETRNKDFYVEWMSVDEFKFLSKTSYGTAIVAGIPGLIDGIKGYGKINQDLNNRITIELSTKIRIELYFLIGFYVLVGLICFTKMSQAIIILLLSFPLIIVLYWYVLRVQEDKLFDRVKNHLKE